MIRCQSARSARLRFKDVTFLIFLLLEYGKRGGIDHAMLPTSFSSAATHGEGHDRVLDVHAVFGLVVDDRLRAIDDGIGDFDAAVGGQAVHVDGVLFGKRHTAL